MPITVTLDVFSGRPNPTWRLSAMDSRELLKRVESLETEVFSKPLGVRGNLGYRGFHLSGSAGRSVGDIEFRVHGGLIDQGPSLLGAFDRSRTIEDWLLFSGRSEIRGKLGKHVREQIEKRPVIPPLGLVRATGRCPKCQAVDAPPYAPGPWNTPAHRPKNNCYNYANNKMTDTFAQPGRATGKPITGLSCNGVRPSAISDGLKVTNNFTTKLAKGKGWYVALVIWPGVDYHWYRQDDVGCWSHKPGQTAVRNVDNSGKRISDPKTCNRGPYTTFCTYMITGKGVRIR